MGIDGPESFMESRWPGATGLFYKLLLFMKVVEHNVNIPEVVVRGMT